MDQIYLSFPDYRYTILLHNARYNNISAILFVFCATGFKNFTIGFSLRLRTSFECKYVLSVEREREREKERKKERKSERDREKGGRVRGPFKPIQLDCELNMRCINLFPPFLIHSLSNLNLTFGAHDITTNEDDDDI